jgi:hypothetical protein
MAESRDIICPVTGAGEHLDLGTLLSVEPVSFQCPSCQAVHMWHPYGMTLKPIEPTAEDSDSD